MEELKTWDINTVAGQYKLAMVAAKSKDGDLAIGLVCSKPVYILNSRPLEQACSELMESLRADIKAAGISSMTPDELKNSPILKRGIAHIVDDMFRYAIDDSVLRVGHKNAPAEEDVEYDLIQAGDPVIAVFDMLNNLGLKESSKEEPAEDDDDDEESDSSVEDDSQEVLCTVDDISSEPEAKLVYKTADGRFLNEDEIFDELEQNKDKPGVGVVKTLWEGVINKDPKRIKQEIIDVNGSDEMAAMCVIEDLLEKSEFLTRNIKKISDLKRIDAYDSIDDTRLQSLMESLDSAEQVIADILLHM